MSVPLGLTTDSENRKALYGWPEGSENGTQKGVRSASVHFC